MTEASTDKSTDGKFARRLGLIGATNIGLGAMLGGGIYVISGTAAGMVGPVIVLAYLVTGLLTVFTAINYSELASSIPKQGGGYTFAADTYGGFPGFLTGWFLFLGNIVACGLYSLAVAYSFLIFIPGATESMVGLIAVVIIFITLVTNIISIKGVTGILGILNIAQSVVLFSFIFIGLAFVQPTNLDPLFAAGTGFPQFMSAVSFIYISFVGFDLITTASEEIKEPARNIPRAILLTLGIATIVYVIAALVIVGVSGYEAVAESNTPIGDVFGFMLGPGAVYLGLAGMAASNYAALNATFLATARVAFSMGRDRYFPKFLDSVNQKFKTPVPALILTFVLVSIFAFPGDVSLVASLAAFGYLIAQAIVNSSVIMLRRKGLSVLSVPGTFKTPFFPLIPVLGVIVCIVLIPSLASDTLVLGVYFILIGLVVYALYGRRRNRKHIAILNGETV
ncbi:MAG: APC family permease [Candidatus Thorarchaeota archaeon]